MRLAQLRNHSIEIFDSEVERDTDQIVGLGIDRTARVLTAAAGL